MLRGFALIVLAGALLAGLALPASAKTVSIPIYWSIAKGELSIARMRTSVGPKIRNYVCTTYRKGQHPGNVLKSGGSVKVTFYGFGNTVLTSFTYSRRDCS